MYVCRLNTCMLHQMNTHVLSRILFQWTHYSLIHLYFCSSYWTTSCMHYFIIVNISWEDTFILCNVLSNKSKYQLDYMFLSCSFYFILLTGHINILVWFVYEMSQKHFWCWLCMSQFLCCMYTCITGWRQGKMNIWSVHFYKWGTMISWQECGWHAIEKVLLGWPYTAILC